MEVYTKKDGARVNFLECKHGQRVERFECVLKKFSRYTRRVKDTQLLSEIIIPASFIIPS